MASITKSPVAAILFFLLPAIAIAADVALSPTVAVPLPESADFVSQSCKLTKYQDLCIKALSPFAKSIKQDDLSAVTLKSLDVTLSVAMHSRKRMSGFLVKSNDTNGAGDGIKQNIAMKFCVTSHVDTVGQLGRAINVVKNIGSVSEEELTDSFSEADYDVSLCLTYMNECIDQWKDLPTSSVKTEVFRTSEKVRKYVANARDILTKFNSVLDSKTKHKGLLV
ncbi:hypothetical protein ACHQM5_011783 [Ranunculus cassubicifolius]